CARDQGIAVDGTEIQSLDVW
nr:immunoglobulin heavy chain junction region [Macaca mulatta]MOX00668.1 immunoglobulin heavy chain junction region [Macaca mulatta]MOX03345.1 immunoglobulin heavy chain junction region [Macaca mulatta]MOX05653.1 immunoglobulin heavy chain junction region [Macaca mulatta]